MVVQEKPAGRFVEMVRLNRLIRPFDLAVDLLVVCDEAAKAGQVHDEPAVELKFRAKADAAKRGLLTCFRRFWPESRGLSPVAPHHTL